MTVCEKLNEYLKQEGMCPETAEHGLNFKYQMANFVHFKDDADPNFFQLCFPAIFETTEENTIGVLKAINLSNSSVKGAYAAVVNENQVWVFFESLLQDDPGFEDIVPRGLNLMLAYRERFYQALQMLGVLPKPEVAEQQA